MRKPIILLFSLIALLAFALPAFAGIFGPVLPQAGGQIQNPFAAFVSSDQSASQPSPSIPPANAIFLIGQKTYYVAGQARQMDVAPFTENGRAYVPMRYLGYALGADENGVGWDEASQTATLTVGSITEKFTIGSKTYTVNGQAQTMDVAPVTRNGRIFFPARYVAEALGYTVDWKPDQQAVVVYKGAEPSVPAQTAQPTTGTGGGKVNNDGSVTGPSIAINGGGGPSDGPPILPSKQL